MNNVRFTRETLDQVLSNPTSSVRPELATTGIGSYRNLYRRFGKETWDFKPAKAVQLFFEQESPQLEGKTMIDLGAGTGKNIIEFVRQGVSRALAVEIDSIAARELLDTTVLLEESGILEEGIISVYKEDVRRYLASTNENFDIGVSYGLLHVFRNPNDQLELLNNICNRIRPSGYVILQSLTDKYPAPKSQPELEGITVTENAVHGFFSEKKEHWEIKYFDNTDITHSHAGAEEEHKHGSVRIICKKH